MSLRPRASLLASLLPLGILACSAASDPAPAPGPAAAPTCKADTDCAAATPLCGPASACVALPPGNEIGYRDGTPASVTLTTIGSFGATAQPVDLGFHTERTDELWVIDYGDDAVHVGSGISTDAPSWKRILDPAAGHFAHKPPALAMGSKTSSTGDGSTWASCGDNDNGQNQKNSDGTANLFMGPALFSGDLSVYGKATPGGLGSHLDMLHESPNCRGIAHVDANIYWVFNAYDKALDKYDFHKDHGPGQDDHSDGTVDRCAMGKVKGADDGTPSHLFYDATDAFLYVADTGNKRVLRMDTKSGTKGGFIDRVLDPIAEASMVNDVKLEVVVAEGILTAPSGIQVHGDLVYVTDAATSQFHVYDKTGMELRSLDTGLPKGSLSGFTFGTDGKIYFTDKVTGRVLRIDTQ